MAFASADPTAPQYSYGTDWYWQLMEKDLDDAKDMVGLMMKEIENFEESLWGGARQQQQQAGGGVGKRASISVAAPQALGRPRRRQQILFDNSIGNEVSSTVVEVEFKTRETILKIKCILKAHYLFQSLNDDDLKELIDQMKPEQKGDGDIIIQQGDLGDKFYIMEEGECDIIVGETKVGSYKGGQAFGDLALLSNAPRAATILATADCTLWTLDREFFVKAKRNTNLNGTSDLKAFLSGLKLFGSKVPFFGDLSPDKLTQLCEALKEKHYPPKLVDEEGQPIPEEQLSSQRRIIRQGDSGEHFYILYKGVVNVIETLPDGSEKFNVQLGKYCGEKTHLDAEGNHKKKPDWQGVIFGERALIKKEPRARNIDAASVPDLYEKPDERAGQQKRDGNGDLMFVTKQVTVLSLEKKDFESLLGHKIKEMTDMNDFRILQTVEIFKGGILKDKRLHKVQSALLKTFCYLGERIETNADDLFIILDGVFETPEGRLLRSGDVIGDLRRSATDIAIAITCRTDDDAKPCYAKISRQAVLDHIAGQAIDPADTEDSQEVPEISPEEIGKRELLEVANRRAESIRQRREANRTTPLPRDLTELETIRPLGVGMFGTVHLARHKPTGRLIALKCLDMASTVSNKQELCVQREAQALDCLCHPFVADYYGVIVAPRKVVFMLEFIPGGELFSYLYSDEAVGGEYGGLSLLNATRYAACIAMALEHIHSLGYVYRDLKPENVLIASNGYLKLIDFGLAKQVPFENDKGGFLYRTFTICGTPEYMPPEIVQTSGCDKSADFWALGVIFYEMLLRKTPFDCEGNQKATFEKISRPTLKIWYPLHFDAHATVFLRGLLKPNPALRLGNLQNGYSDIYEDPVFTSQGAGFVESIRSLETPMDYIPAPFSSSAGALSAEQQAEMFDCAAEAIASEEDLYTSTFKNLEISDKGR